MNTVILTLPTEAAEQALAVFLAQHPEISIQESEEVELDAELIEMIEQADREIEAGLSYSMDEMLEIVRKSRRMAA